MGGDHGLPVTVPAAINFCRREPQASFLLVGQADAIGSHLTQVEASVRERLQIVSASEVVTMDDPVEVALRRKKDSSMRVAATLVKEGKADVCVSAGNTGAWMAITRYVLKMLPGIDRPALTAAIPDGKGGGTIMLDLGANVDCSAEHLLQFGIMGSALAAALEGRENPRVGLLNVGEEVIKGNEVVKEAAELLRASKLNFHGNVEGNEIFQSSVDVVVCDGFVGNVVLKSTEGLARMIGGMIRQQFQRDLPSRMSGLAAYPVLRRLREDFDSRRYNGAALLGLRGVVFKSHGSADAYAYGWAIQRAYDAVAGGLQQRTASTLRQLAPDSSHAAQEVRAS